MEYAKDYYGFVYIWYNRVALTMERQKYEDRHRRLPKKHPRLYIGAHMGSVDDGYVCSSTWMKKAYKRNPQNFMRRVLYWQKTPDRKELLKAEEKWLKKIKTKELGSRFYNFKRCTFPAPAHSTSPMKGRKHKQKSKYLMSKRKNGLIVIHYGQELRFVTKDDAAWMVLSEGWQYGNSRSKGRPRKKSPLT